MKQRFFPMFIIFFFMFCAFAPSLNAQGYRSLDFADMKKEIRKIGKPIVIVNIFSIYCPACRNLIPILNDLRNNFEADKIAIIGIALEDPDESRALTSYVKRNKIKYPVHLGDDDLARTLRIRYIPRTLLYNAKSELLDEWTGVPAMKDMAASIRAHLPGR